MSAAEDMLIALFSEWAHKTLVTEIHVMLSTGLNSDT